MSGWQLLDNKAQAYERWLVPPIFSPFADDLVADVAPGSHVLDVACGTGIVARRAAAKGATVVGVDLNEQMLQVARDVAPDIEWVAADAADLPLDDESFDLVFCQQGLQFMSDPAAAVAEMRRVVAPGGRLTMSVWRACEGFEILAGILDEENAAVMRSPFARGNEICRLVGGDVRTVVKTVRFPSSDELLAREVASSPMTIAIDGALQSAFATAIRRFTDEDGVSFPMETYVLRAQ
jgi:SAM-dependent methyltransferase